MLQMHATVHTCTPRSTDIVIDIDIDTDICIIIHMDTDIYLEIEMDCLAAQLDIG